MAEEDTEYDELAHHGYEKLIKKNEMSQVKNILPQEGRDLVPESLPGTLPGCPSDSGGGKTASSTVRKVKKVSMEITKEEKQIFGRAGIQRTPPQTRRRANSLPWESSPEETPCSPKKPDPVPDPPNAELDETDKRKRGKETPPKEPTKRGRVEVKEKIIVWSDWQDLSLKMGLVKKAMATVRLQISDNTSLKIKNSVSKLLQEVITLESMFGETEIAMKETGKEDKVRNDMGTQVDPNLIENDLEEAREKSTAQILGIINNGTDFKDLTPILDTTWPEEVYTAVEIIPEAAARDLGGDIVFLRSQDEGDMVRLKQVTAIYPDMNEMLEDPPQSGVDYLKVTTKVTTRTGAKEKDRFLFTVSLEDCMRNGLLDCEAFWEKMVSCRDLVVEQGRTEVTLSIPLGLDALYVRKLTEFTFRKSGTRVKLVASGNDQHRGRGVSTKKAKRAEGETLIIKSDGRSFAELVRGVKSNVDINEVGINVRAIKRTNGGDLLLRVEGNTGQVNILKHQISEKIDGAQVTTRNSNKVLFITDIDAGMEAEEVSLVLKESMNTNDVKVVSMKPTRDGNQVATVEVRAGIAKTWAERGRIKIGWVSCRVRGKPNITRCYKCLEFGHRRSDCTGPDRTLECLKCGKNSHKAKECKGEPFCGMCKEEGHRHDSRRCPQYQSLLKDASTRRPTKRATRNT